MVEQRASTGREGEAPAELIGGWLALDFVNTMHDLRRSEDRDDLGSYGDLVSWALVAELITEEPAERMMSQARERPVAAEQALRKAKVYRETIYSIFAATAHGGSPDGDDLGRLNRALQESHAHAKLVAQPAGFDWEWVMDDGELDGMLWPIIGSAGDLLVSEELARTRQCDADDCTWLFIDNSKNLSRHWCRMAGCGNRAKARRHYARMQGTGQAHD